MHAIDNHAVTVNVTAENTKRTSTGLRYNGGAFMGNTVGKAADGSNTVQTAQEINPQVLGAMDSYYNKPGKGTLHEVVESYLGGEKSQKTGIASGTGNDPQNYYQRSHNRAPSQEGPAFETFYDSSHNVVPAAAATSVELSVQEGTRPAQVIQVTP